MDVSELIGPLMILGLLRRCVGLGRPAASAGGDAAAGRVESLHNGAAR
ncbi:MAG TPA: hypothetical protein VIL18_14825 [Longimicrobiales bacterium]